MSLREYEMKTFDFTSLPRASTESVAIEMLPSPAPQKLANSETNWELRSSMPRFWRHVRFSPESHRITDIAADRFKAAAEVRVPQCTRHRARVIRWTVFSWRLMHAVSLWSL